MKEFDLDAIRSWEPCYDPSEILPEDWRGTVFDILDNKDIPFRDRVWVIMRADLVSKKLMRLFAVWCARQVQHEIKDERSLKAIEVAERFALGEATEVELSAARSAAESAARSAAWSAARSAAESAAWSAAESAQEAHLRKMLLAGIETGDVR